MATNELGPLLIELQRIIESSTVFRIAPHYERWQNDLESLDKARLELTAVKVGVEHLKNAPRALVHDVGQLHHLLEGFVDLRDHFRKQFPSGGDSQDWTELETAKRKLTQVQHLTDKIQLNLCSESYTTPQGAEPVMPWRWFLLGVFLLLVAVGFGVWAFQRRCLTTQQVALLRFFLPLAGGFAAWTFSGSITARARNLIPGVAIVAVGGGAVFVITTFVVLDPEKLKLDCTPPTVACSEQAPCVDVTRSMDFSAAGCEGDKPKDVLVIDDEVTRIPPASVPNQKYTFGGQFTPMNGQKLDVSLVGAAGEETPLNRTPNSASLQWWTFETSFPIGAPLHVRYRWVNVNYQDPEDQGVRYTPTMKTRNFRVVLAKPPPGNRIVSGSERIQPPAGSQGDCIASKLACNDLYVATPIDISWRWASWPWEGCDKL